jgi:adenylate cyclase
MTEKHNLFHSEEKVLKKAVEIIEQFEGQDNLLLEEYKYLFKAYKKLLKQTKRLVKMSDKQQYQLTHLAEGLQSNNIELQHKAQVAEQAIQANEKKLAQFLEAVPIGVFVIDANCSPYYANKTAQQILGNSLVPSPLIQSGPNQSSFLDAMPSELKPIVQTLQNKMTNVDDIEIQQGDKIIPIEVWVVPIFDEDNDIAYAIAAFQDISERKQAEIERKKFTQALQESEERFRVIAETTPIPLVISRLSDSLILYANAQVKTVTGLSATELVDHYHTIDFYHNPEERIELLKLLHQDGYIRNYEIQIKKQNQTVIWVEVCIQPMVFKHENVLLTTFYDISERKRVEEERIRFTQELAQLNQAYERFVPREFLSLLEKQSIIDVQLGDHVEKDITILFSDIRGFTALSEKMTPHQNFYFINEYLSQMEPIIFENHGIIDKYIGDAIMALFPTCADDAVRGSIAMLKKLTVFNQKRQEDNFLPIFIGIGLNSGPSMLGTVGGTARMDTTVISDAVNLASRVEELTKIYGTALLITEQTYLELADPLQYHVRVIDIVKVKGKSQEVTVYEIYDADSPTIIALKDKTRDEFEEGFVLYHFEEFKDASPFFEQVLKTNPNDKVAHIYLKRCRHFQKHGVPLEL